MGGLLSVGILVAAPPPAHEGRIEARSIQEVMRGPRTRHCVALTFDAGGETTGLPELLTSLEAAKVHATFFLTGRWAAEHPQLARAIQLRGHEIGNHTWSHHDLTMLDDAHVRSEILRAGACLAGITKDALSTAFPPRRLFRAPYGARDARVLRIVGELGYTSIYWTLDSLDSIEPAKTPEFLIARITGLRNDELDGAIVLMHVGEPSSAAALPAIIADLQRRGFQMGTISELLSPQEMLRSAKTALDGRD